MTQIQPHCNIFVGGDADVAIDLDFLRTNPVENVKICSNMADIGGDAVIHVQSDCLQESKLKSHARICSRLEDCEEIVDDNWLVRRQKLFVYRAHVGTNLAHS
eukprot:CAMPEP_0196747112 /NCGR_PEP_ID=MMETSP1091-20130531/68320_1 /TAXON_ID=302021 /ORGANISM="Rhodomonas sp., Strain CCMP768" /LENGTH=102 /DNA_ID=CAMNT_0042094193 /DNA_START=47 /DNA_END=352 /DNA_ORIENTATION=+